MRNPTAIVFLAATFLASISAFGADEKTSDAAKKFINTGTELTLKGCDLGKSVCGGGHFIVSQKGKHESNDMEYVDKTLTLPGLQIGASFPATAPTTYGISSVVVTSATWPVLYGLRVGTDRTIVMAKLGKGISDGIGCMTYSDEESQSSVSFCFEKEKVAKITWSPWSD